MFFYTVNFPSAVWYLSQRSRCRLCTGEPPEDIPPDLQSGAESKTEGGRERDALMKCHPGTLPGTQARAHTPDAAPFPRTSPLKPVEVGAPVGASTMPEKAGAMGPPSSQLRCTPPAWSLGWTYPGTPPSHPLRDMPGKSICTKSPAQRPL